MTRSAVDGFVSALPAGWKRDCCVELLADIRALPTPLQESIKWGNPHFDRHGAVTKWYVAKDWINVYFYKGHLLDDPGRCFEPTANSRMRMIKIIESRSLNRAAFTALLRTAVDLNSPA